MEWTGQKTPRPLHVTPLPGMSGHATLDPMVSICADREQNCSVGSMTSEKGVWKGPREEAVWSPGLMGELFRPRGTGQGKVKKELVKRWQKWKSVEAKAGEKLRPTCEEKDLEGTRLRKRKGQVTRGGDVVLISISFGLGGSL